MIPEMNDRISLAEFKKNDCLSINECFDLFIKLITKKGNRW